MEWTDAVINQLRALWAEGHSTAEIGRRLGVTKNAIVGKAHRLDLPARPSPIRRDPNAEPVIRVSARRVEGTTLPPLPSAVAETAFLGFEAMVSVSVSIPDSAQIGAEPVAAAPPAAISPEPPAMSVTPPAVAETAPVQAAVARTEAPVQSVRPPPPVSVRPPAAAMPRPVMVPPRPLTAPPHRTMASGPRISGRVVTCCWPIGEPGTRDFHFCDVPSEPGRPYCEDHVRIAYVKVRDRREDAA